jgi:hypothetical protein
MKPTKSHTLLTLSAIFSLALFSGCYTELTLVSDEPANTGETDPGEIYQPGPIVIVPVPIVVIPEPVYIPTPVAGTPTPQVGTGHQNNSGRRDFGNQRTGTSSGGGGQRGANIRTQSVPTPAPVPPPLPPVVNSGSRTNKPERGQR